MRRRNSNGLSLIEMVITLALSSLAVMAVAGIYLSAMNFFQSLFIEKGQVSPLYAVEEITRNVAKANKIYVPNGNSRELYIRVDNNGIAEWGAYGLVPEEAGGTSYRLRFQDSVTAPANPEDPPPPATFTDSTPEIQPGLVLRDVTGKGASHFEQGTDENENLDIKVRIFFIADEGYPPVQRTIDTSATARLMLAN